MAIDIIGVLVFVAVLRAFFAYELSVKFSAFTVVVVAFVVRVMLQIVPRWILDLPVEQLFSAVDVVIALAQLPVALFVFLKIRQVDGSLAAWMSYAALGLVVNYVLLFYLVPMVVL